MTTCEPLSNGGDPNHDQPLMPSLEGFHASHSVSQESNWAPETSAGHGPGCKPSYAHYDPDTCWWKTSQLSFEIPELSELSSPTFTDSGSMRNGQLYEHPTSGRPITVDGSTCWPTPRASIGRHGIAWTRAETGKHRWQLEDYLAWQYIASGGQRVSGWSVNPEWAGWLMGFPTRWTDCE
jgi:hypothetical protein